MRCAPFVMRCAPWMISRAKAVFFCSAVLLSWSAKPCLAEDVPLPPRRPPIAQPLPAAAQDDVSLDADCAGLLRDKRMEGDILPDVMGANGCGIVSPVLLKTILLENGAKIAVTPPVLMRCTLAAALVQWLRADVAVALAGDNQRLTGLASAGGYECRSRNRIAGSAPSEHGHGNAIDIAAFLVAPGPPLAIGSAAASRDVFQKIHQSACARFMTVLGPGSDGFHESHLHLDLQPRRSETHICQWQIN